MRLPVMLRVVLAALALALARSAPVAAEAPKVAVIDLSKAFDAYRLTKDLEQRFDEQRRLLAAEADKRRAEIDFKRQELANFNPDGPDYKTRREQLTKMEIEFEVWAGVNEQQLRDSHKDWLLKIYTDIRSAVEAIAKEQGIDLVLTYEEVTADAPDSKALRQQLLLEKVLYFSKTLDLTETVVESVNKNYKGPETIKLGRSGSRPQSAEPVNPALTEAR